MVDSMIEVINQKWSISINSSMSKLLMKEGNYTQNLKNVAKIYAKKCESSEQSCYYKGHLPQINYYQKYGLIWKLYKHE